MNKERLILTDVDGVLLYWTKAFDRYMESRGFPRVPNSDHMYLLAPRHGMSEDEIMPFVIEFNEGHHITSLEPFADAQEYVSKLAENKFRFIAITSLSDSPVAKSNREQNLSNIFGNIFEDVICLPTNGSKSDTLVRWKDSGLFWIEDLSHHAEVGHSHGLQPILIEQPYNSHFSTDLFPIVSNSEPWKEIYHIIRDEYNF